MHINAAVEAVMDAGFRVHRELGPGLLESTYEACLTFELARNRIAFRRQVPIPLVYAGHRLDCGYRLDLLVEEKLVVEVKSAKALAPIFTAQILTYMRLGGFHAGLLMNFNTRLLKEGIRRLVWNYEGPRPSECGGG